jgi:hypothetical protein
MTLEVRCPGCDAIVGVTLVATHEYAAVLECAGCKGHLRLAVGAEEVELVGSDPEPEEPAAGRMRCPKCETEQDEAPACRVCGLHAEYIDSYGSEAEQGGELAGAWAELENEWDQAAAHERFIEKVVAGKHFAEAARLYRRRARTGDPVAPRYLERVGTMAAALLSLGPESKVEEPPEPYRNLALLLFVLVAIAVAVGAFAVSRMS